MAGKLQRPVLTVGLGLTGAFWLIDSLQSSVSEWGGVAAFGTVAALIGARFLLPKSPKFLPEKGLPVGFDRKTVETELVAVQQRLQHLQAEAGATVDWQPIQANFERRRTELIAALEDSARQIAIMGGQSTGKTTLLQALQCLPIAPTLSFQDLPALFTAADPKPAADSLPNVDLVLFLTTGDLTDPEFQTLSQLAQNGQRTLLILNKQDQYLPGDRALVLQKIRERVREWLAAADVVSITTQPTPIKVRQFQADGSVQERMDCPKSDLVALTDRLPQLLREEGQSLVWARVWRSARTLKAEVQMAINRLRRDRAMPVIEQYQWIAAAAAFANPLPGLDLLANTAINAQMVIDLGSVYQQQFSVDQARLLAGTLAKQLLQLGLVEISTQMITSFLKGNLVTYLAGGALQGVSAAYLTRVAGLSLIEFFQEQSLANEVGSQNFTWDQIPTKMQERLGEILKSVFQRQRANSLPNFVHQAIPHLSPEPIPLQLPASTTEPLPLLLSEPERREFEPLQPPAPAQSLESSALPLP
ncbi:MAG: DUF697 domain-containing protein [Leptolyngbyaceae cyanobacterium bins.59]|nr:DUF697 domain-containing protein [Leptolyngbyaceae cyanobacterium bins.59]